MDFGRSQCTIISLLVHKSLCYIFDMPSKTTTKKPNKQSLKGILVAASVGVILVILSSMVQITYRGSLESVVHPCALCDIGPVRASYTHTRYGLPLGYYTNSGYAEEERHYDDNGNPIPPFIPTLPLTVGIISPQELVDTLSRDGSQSSDPQSQYISSTTQTPAYSMQPAYILFNLAFWSVAYYFFMRYIFPKFKSWRLRKKTNPKS